MNNAYDLDPKLLKRLFTLRNRHLYHRSGKYKGNKAGYEYNKPPTRYINIAGGRYRYNEVLDVYLRTVEKDKSERYTLPGVDPIIN